MSNCPSCNAKLTDADLLSTRCAACGARLDVPEDDHNPKEQTPSSQGNLDETIDSVDSVDLPGPPAQSDKGKKTVPDTPIDQTIDSVDLPGPPVVSDKGKKTVPETPIDQTIDSVDSIAGELNQADKKKKTVPERGVDQTIDIDEASQEAAKDGTHGPLDQTLDSDLFSSDPVQQVNATWSGVVQEGVTVGTSLKVDSSREDNQQSTLVIQQRAFKSTELKEQKHVAQADYDLIDILGEGGMGRVYAARQGSIDRTVAIKMLKPDTAANRTQRNKFLSEAVVTGELEHPNIVPIYDLGANDEGALFYAMKRVVGTPWLEVIDSKSLHENIEILMRVADAVAFAHDRNVIHRDLKPENVMLGDFGEVLVMDWGLAVPSDQRKIGGLTQATSMGGTPAYMAPEMASGPFARIGAASDIYLLGAILYEIVTGLPPHTGKDVMACLRAAAKNEIQSTKRSGELVDIALKAMATNPADRYAKVTDFQDAIREYLSHSESIALSTRAALDLDKASSSDDYQDYARSLFGFQEALALWNENEKAAAGISQASSAYASSALKKGDFDLGLSLLDDANPDHATLIGELRSAEAERNARQRRLKALRRTILAGTALFIFVVLGATWWIWLERGKAIAARNDAIEQKVIAEGEREKAEESRKVAVAAEKVAVQERDKAEKARQDAVVAEKIAVQEKDKAEKARMAAVAAEKVAVMEKDKAEKARQAAVAAEKVAVEEKEKAEKAQLAEAKARQAAVAAEKVAVMEKDKAEKARQAAVAAEKVAVVERDKAEKARIEADIQRDKAEYEAYIALIGLAAAKIEENAFGTARQLLDQCPPKLRNWEWGRLMHVCSQSVMDYPVASPVDAVAYSRDGKRFVSGGWNGQAQIWDAQSGKLLQTIDHGSLHFVQAVAFSPDGNYVATGCNDQQGYLRIWDADSGALVRRLVGHREAVVSLAFSPDGKQLLSGSQDNTARIWNVADGSLVRTLHGHRGWVWAAAFSPDQKRVVTASQDGFAIVWDLSKKSREPGEQSHPFRGHHGPIYAAAFSPDGKSVVTGGYDKQVMLWKPEEIEPFDFDKVIANELKGPGEKLDPLTPPKFRLLDGHSAAVRSVAFSADGRRIISGGHDNTVRIWDTGSASLLKTLRGHDSWVRSCVFSPDGKWVLSGSHDRQVKRWSLERYEEVRRIPQGRVLEGHTADILAASFSRDGRHIVTASRDRTAKTWNLSTGTEEKSFTEGHSFLASSAVFFADGKRMITGAVDNTARIWNVASGTELLRLDDCGRSAAVAVSPDGKWILTGSNENAARLWELSTSKNQQGQIVLRAEPRRMLGNHRVEVAAVAFSADGRQILTGDVNGRCNLWEFQTGKLLHTLRAHTDRITAVAFLPDGSRAITASGDKTVAQWDLTNGKELQRLLLKHPDAVTDMAVSVQSNHALTCCADGKVRYWDLEKASVLHTLSSESTKNKNERMGLINAVALSRDGRWGATVNSESRSVRIWDLSNGKQLRPASNNALDDAYIDFRRRGLLWAVNFSPNSGQLVTVGGDNARLWDFLPAKRPEKETMTFIPHGTIASASYSPDGKLVVTSSLDGSARIWSTETGKGLRKLEGQHRGYVNSAVFSPGGGEILTAGNDGKAILWKIESGQALKTFTGHDAAIHWASFSADGKYILTASEDTTARIWDASTGKVVKVLQGNSDYEPGHRYGVLRAEFSHDGKRIITGGKDNRAKIWDVATGKVLLELEGHTAAVTSVAFAPDGKRVLTGSEDFSAILWDAQRIDAGDTPADAPQTAKAKEIMTLKGHDQEVTSVSFSPNGVYALTASRDGTAIIWLANDLWKQPPAVASRSK